MSLSKRCAIFDIDGTIANGSHRVHHIDTKDYTRNSKERWQAFFAGIPDDLPIEPVLNVLRVLNERTFIVLCTGRGEENRAATEDWLARHMVPYSKMYMRPAGCYRPDHEIKGEMLGRVLRDGWEPFIVFDDRQAVVDMWRSRGLVCAQVAPGNF